MVHIGKNNPRSFQLWDYLVSILEDKSWAAKTALTPTFDGFIERVRALWSKKFSEG